MVRLFDVCNGDADGLCAAVQWRLHAPAPAALLTGLKREIALLARVPAAAGDELNVFDLSMRPNREALQRLLDAGVRVRYFDHHVVEDMPAHPLLESHVDTASDVCTSLLVYWHLGGAFRAWALVGIYGDNLAAVADRLALESDVDAGDCALLRRLGEAINYNAYGDEERDVHIAPRALHATMMRYRDPRDMLAHEAVIDEIDAQRHSDLQQALAVAPLCRTRVPACACCRTRHGAGACSAASPTRSRTPSRIARTRCSSSGATAATPSACARRWPSPSGAHRAVQPLRRRRARAGRRHRRTCTGAAGGASSATLRAFAGASRARGMFRPRTTAGRATKASSTRADVAESP